MPQNPQESADRYRAIRDGDAVPDEVPAQNRPWTPAELAGVVEAAIQQAQRQGAFENLPGAGKPIEDLGTHHDPDWWIRRKIQTEDLHGLGPAALTLRVEDAAFRERLDELGREQDVREAVADFNARVRHARMQLQGGPPVVTPLRDEGAEVAAWHERRRPQTQPDGEPQARSVRRRWFRR